MKNLNGATCSGSWPPSSALSSTYLWLMRADGISAGTQSARMQAIRVAGLLVGTLLVVSDIPARAESAAVLGAEALQHVNASREAEGLATLEPGGTLDDAAQGHAEDMLERDYYSHVTPEGDGPRQRFLDAGGGQWEVVAENIARCRNCGDLDRQRVAEFHQGWMNSPEHRDNILRTGLTRFGFGAATEAGVGLDEISRAAVFQKGFARPLCGAGEPARDTRTRNGAGLRGVKEPL